MKPLQLKGTSVNVTYYAEFPRDEGAHYVYADATQDFEDPTLHHDGALADA